MSKTLNFVVEGPTEKDFVENCIYPYLLSRGISSVRPITIETSPGFKGGDIRYARFKPNVTKLLMGQEDMIVTSLIDFYKVRSDFPKYTEAMAIANRKQSVAVLEKACFDDIKDERFVPYIQLHEFEGLLFADKKGFNLFDGLQKGDLKELLETVDKYPNPEDINDGAATAPSKRLLRLIPEYQKPFHGNMIALENGFEVILNKCPRFKSWIQILIYRMTT